MKATLNSNLTVPPAQDQPLLAEHPLLGSSLPGIPVGLIISISALPKPIQRTA